MLSGLNNGLAVLLSLVDVLPLVTEKSILTDITITNNIAKNVYSGFGMSSAVFPWVIERVLFENNLFYDIWADGRSCMLLFCEDVKVNHNTCKAPCYYARDSVANFLLVIPVLDDSLVGAIGMGYDPTVNVSFTNNIAAHGRYGIIGDGHGSGTDTIEQYAGPAETVNERWQANILFTTEPPGPGAYPPRFYFPTLENICFVDYVTNFTLSEQSPYKNNGTDGTDIGVNMGLLLSKLAGVLEGTYGADIEAPDTPNVNPVTAVAATPIVSGGDHIRQLFRFTAVVILVSI
jgi:hypothetical protein